MASCDYSWLWGALIGVASTILGTILGWLLSKPKNKKINIILNKPIDLIESRKPVGSTEDKKNYLYSLNFLLNLVFYNPSDKVKIMRNIRICFYDLKNKKIITLPIKDLENTSTIIPGIKVPLGIDSINIAPQSGELFRCCVVFYKEEIEILNVISKACVMFDDENDNEIAQEIKIPNLKDIKIYN